MFGIILRWSVVIPKSLAYDDTRLKEFESVAVITCFPSCPVPLPALMSGFFSFSCFRTAETMFLKIVFFLFEFLKSVLSHKRCRE